MKKIMTIIALVSSLNIALASENGCIDCAAPQNSKNAIALASISRSIASKIEQSDFEVKACSLAIRPLHAIELVKHFKAAGKRFEKDYASVRCHVVGGYSTLFATMLENGAFGNFNDFFNMLTKASEKSGINQHAVFYNVVDMQGHTLLDYINETIESIEHTQDLEMLEIAKTQRAKIIAVGAVSASQLRS